MPDEIDREVARLKLAALGVEIDALTAEQAATGGPGSSGMAELRVGASGFSFASWRPGFYPAGTKPGDFLAHYAGTSRPSRSTTASTGCPTASAFAKWARTVPDGFRFSVKAPRAVTVFGRVDFVPGPQRARPRRSGDRLGPLLVRLADKQRARRRLPRTRSSTAIDDDLDVALDLRDPSWDGIEPELDALGRGARQPARGRGAGFRYLRLRDPPYDDAALAAWAATIRGLLEGGLDVYCYFRHEDEPTAPAYAARLRELVNG